MTDQMDVDTPIERVDLRTRAGRALKAAQHAVAVEEGAAARTEKGTQARSLARGQYLGRNGEVLQRQETSGVDQFSIVDGLKEEGWDYQWNAHAVVGNSDLVRRDNNTMHNAGWRAVMAVGRWNGVFFPAKYTGHIVINDMGLYERPKGMSDDARAEDLRRALAQVQDRDQSLMGGKANVRDAMQSGFAMSPGRYRGTGADIRMSIDPGLDIPRPAHKVSST